MPDALVATSSYLVPMRAVGIKALKNRLSEYLKLVAEGEVVLITDRDVVVAELRQPAARSPHVADAALAELVRTGVLTPPMTVREGAPPRPPDGTPLLPLSRLLSELDEMRRDRT
jgi:antitoxin (DNA-binding transcriptional repressor) of toxin-antitoxin stability system